MSWRLIVNTGFNEVMGSWKTIEIWLPRIFRIWSAGIWTMSLPWNRIFPLTILPGGSGIKRITERALTLLPEPLSPTRARVSPSFRFQFTPSTALTTPVWV